jgi:hypothetical protein
MIKSQKIRKGLVLLLIVAGLFSCNDDDNTSSFEVIGDVFVTKKIIGDEIMYGMSYYAYGTYAMETAEVITPEGEEIALTAVNGYETTYSKDPSTDDFTSDMPDEGNYQFNVLNEGITHQSIDLLEFDDLDFPELTSVEMDDYVLTVEWETSSSVGAYWLRLLDESGSVIYVSSLLSNESSTLQIDDVTASGTWASGYPNDGDVYTLQLQAITFDSGAGSTDYLYHLKEVAISEQEVTWEYTL